MKRILLPALCILGATTLGASAAAADVTTAVTGLATEAGTGVTAGVTIGAVVFGAKVVWGAIKSLAS